MNNSTTAQEESTQHELSLLLDEELDEEEVEEVEPTSFDDVAMILLLFFMVTSLMIYFPREKQEEKRRNIPVVEDKTLIAHPPAGVTHRLFVKTDPSKSIVLEIQALGAHPVVKTADKSFFTGDSLLWSKDERSAFKEGILGLMKHIVPSKGEPYPVDVVVFFDHDFKYGKMQKVWNSLSEMGNTDEVFKSKVARIAWRSEVLVRGTN